MNPESSHKTIRISSDSVFLDEVQTITVTDGDGADTFILTYQGQNTPALAWNISAAGLKAAIDTLLVALGADVVVTESGGVYTVTMSGGSIGGTNTDEFTSTPTGCTVAHATTRVGGRQKLIKGSPSTLRSVFVGGVPSLGGTITFYDGIDASGTIKGTLDVTHVPVVGGGNMLAPMLYGPLDWQFKEGLFIDIGALVTFSFTLAYD